VQINCRNKKTINSKTHSMKATLLPRVLLPVCIFFAGAIHTQAQTHITHSAGEGDLTFFYDRDNNTFDTVFRAKGDTNATNLTDIYGNPPGGVGGSVPAEAGDPGDYLFSTLTIFHAIDAINTINVEGTDFLNAAPGLSGTGSPDLGIRTRFRELDSNNNEVDQFAFFRMTLDWGNSTVPLGAEFALFNVDAFNNPNVIRFNSAESTFITDWPAWGHSHWNYGFSEYGTYNLVFTFQGLDSSLDPVTSVGSTSVTFNVVPEPSSGLLALSAIGIAAYLRWKKRKQV